MGTREFPLKLAGKIALVTGASKGIGASIAEHLAAEGASVVVNYASSKSGADTVVGCGGDRLDGPRAGCIQIDHRNLAIVRVAEVGQAGPSR